MDQDTLRERLYGCYVTIPTMFNDDDEMSVNLDGIRQHVEFLIDGGIRTGTGVLLACGAAGDFSSMSFDERVTVAGVVVDQAAGRVPVILGAQTTSTRELIALARAAEDVGAEYIQVSPPYYFAHTEGDFYGVHPRRFGGGRRGADRLQHVLDFPQRVDRHGGEAWSIYRTSPA